MKRLALVMLCLSYFKAFAQPVTASNRVDWFKEAKFGLFIHWGLYSILEGSYNGRSLPDKSLSHGDSWYAEWIQQRLEVPRDAYRELVKKFNPEKFDADSWIREARDAGMKYFVITAKHHDGFALWDSKVSAYDLGSTRYRKDILGELAKACRKYGLKYGFYYSHCQDWDHPGGAIPNWMPRKTDARFEQYWVQKCLPQVEELIRLYSPDMFWFDTWGDDQEKTFISDKRRDQLITLIRKQSPKTLINGRISWLNPGKDIDFLEMMDNQYPAEQQKFPWQTPATMVESWGWHAKDYEWKPAKEMVGFLVSNAAKSGNYLLNIGPKPDGTFPAMAIRRLREIGGWMATNSNCIYGTTPLLLKAPPNVCFTQKAINGKTIVYASIINPLTDNKLILPFTPDKIASCQILATGMPLKYESGNGSDVSILLPPGIAAMEDGVQVVQIELK